MVFGEANRVASQGWFRPKTQCALLKLTNKQTTKYMQASIVTRRSKVIFCRVSEQEFTSLQARCAALGLPSVSECLRIAIQQLLAGASPSYSEDLLRDLAKKVDEAVQLLHGRSARMQGAPNQQREAEGYILNANE